MAGLNDMTGISAPQSMMLTGSQQPKMTDPTMQPQQYAQGMQFAAPQDLNTQNIPQTGLIGSEQALNTGFQGALGSLNQGASRANSYLSNVANQNYSDIQQPQLNYTPQTGLNAGVTQPLDQAAANFQPYMQGGQNAAQMQANLSGANGTEAQQQAYAQYQSSPAMKYQMDQMQRATERSAAARGGLMGGNVLQALQQNAAGIASQDYQNQFNNLGTVANQGLNAASNVSNIRGNQAQMAGSMQQAGMGIEGNLAGQQYQSRMNLLNQVQQQKANAISDLANVASQHGLNVAGLYTGTGQQLAQGRTQAGQNIAQNIANSTSAISNLLSQQGIAVSDSMGQDINNITSMIHSAGLADQVDNNQLATLLAQINSGQAVTDVNQNNAIGAANAWGTVGIGNAVTGGLNQALATGLIGKSTPQTAYGSNTIGTTNSGANYRGQT